MSWESLKELLEYTYECLKASNEENEDYYFGMLNAFEIIAFNTHPKEFHAWNMKRMDGRLDVIEEVIN